MRPMLTLTLKDLLLLWRNKAALFWVIAFPLAFGLFYGAIISGSFGPAKLSIAFVDEDKSAVSNALAQKLLPGQPGIHRDDVVAPFEKGLRDDEARPRRIRRRADKGDRFHGLENVRDVGGVVGVVGHREGRRS